MNYNVADFVIRIKNAYLANRKTVTMPYSNMIKAIGQALVKERFISSAKEDVIDGHKMIVVVLRYENRKPVVSDIEVISKPSLRVYTDVSTLFGKHGKDNKVALVSTSEGIMSGKTAKKKGIGGELLFKVW